MWRTCPIYNIPCLGKRIIRIRNDYLKMNGKTQGEEIHASKSDNLYQRI